MNFWVLAALTLVVAQASNLPYCDKSVFARQHIAFSACITFKPGNEYFFSVDNYDSLENLEEAVNNCEKSPIPGGHMAIAREHSILRSPKEINSNGRSENARGQIVPQNAGGDIEQSKLLASIFSYGSRKGGRLLQDLL